MSYETNDKMVSHPDHYKSGKYEVIDIIDEFTKDLSGTEAVCTANAIKYILRWKKKNGIQDVKKAIWYLQHLVDKEEERLREEHAEFDEELLEKKLTCSDCAFYEKGYCKLLNIYNSADHKACGYLDMAIVKKSDSKEVDMDKIMNRPTNEEIHSCDDCVFKRNEPFDDPCQSCDLHLNPPSKWESENATVTDKQVVYAAKVISKYCNSIKGCNDCSFFSPHSVDSVGGITCKFRLNSPNSWDIEEKK